MNARLVKITFLLFVFGCIMTNSMMANNDNNTSAQSVFDLMYSDSDNTLEITIKADIEDLKTNRRTKEYQKAEFSFRDGEKVDHNWTIKIRPRGKFRRRVNEMPPLKLKFKKDDLAESGLNDFNEMKLVTHHSSNKVVSKNYLVREYLAYKMYNELTDNSYRVQFVKINYVDINTGKKEKQFGFIIEDIEQLEARIGGEECDCIASTYNDLHIGQEKMMSLFQYMIGNVDWNLDMVRNLKTFRKNGKVIVVPYDFDFSGMVNASYAVPNTNYGLSSIKERAFIGISDPGVELNSTRSYFKSKKKDIYRVIQKSKNLTAESKEEIWAYLDGFFLNMEDITVGKRKVTLVGESNAAGASFSK